MDTEERIAESSCETSLGTVRIAADVVATIAAMAAAEVPGLSGTSSGVAGGFAEIFGRKNQTKGVKVEVDDNDTSVELFIVVEYGCNIADVSRKAQAVVKEAVENMTGLRCNYVNVHVQGISFPEKEDAAE